MFIKKSFFGGTIMSLNGPIHSTYVEVFQQKESLEKTLDLIMKNKQSLIEFVKGYAPEEVLYVACGSSYWLSMSACLTMQRETGIRCSAIKSGDVVMNGACYERGYKRPLLICPSRSGMTAETVIAAKKFKEWYGAKVLVITAADTGKECTLGDLGDYVIRLPWMMEKARMQTRSFCNMYLSCIVLSAILSDNNDILSDIRWYIDNYDSLAPDAAQRAESICNSEFKEYEFIVSLGTGCQYGLAVEAGYIQLEICRSLAGYFATLEYRHGPYLTNDDKTLFCLFSTSVEIEREEKVIGELKRDKGRVITVSDNVHFGQADWNFTVGRKIAPEIVALYGLMLMYGIAYFRALQKGVNPDMPAQGDPTRPIRPEGFIRSV